MEWSVARKERRFLGAADDKIEILSPVGAQTEGGDVVDVFGVGAADDVRHLTLVQRRQPVLDGVAARHQVHMGLGSHSRVVAAFIQPQILPVITRVIRTLN